VLIRQNQKSCKEEHRNLPEACNEVGLERNAEKFKYTRADHKILELFFLFFVF
jgi:hypothetical protein